MAFISVAFLYLPLVLWSLTVCLRLCADRPYCALLFGPLLDSTRKLILFSRLIPAVTSSVDFYSLSFSKPGALSSFGCDNRLSWSSWFINNSTVFLTVLEGREVKDQDW